MTAVAETRNDFAAPAALGGLQGRALILGAIGLVVAALGLFVDLAHFFQAWLVAFVFWASIALGSLGLLMIHHLSGGAWGVVIRRPLEAAARTAPLLLVAFVPIVLGAHHIYEWSHHDVVAADPILTAKEPYLNVTAFVIRNLVYFALWIWLAYRLSGLSLAQDRRADPKLFRRMQATSAIGFLALALTMTFAAIDWLMSLDPHWFSSLYGLWFFASTGLSALTFVILVAGWLSHREPMARVYLPRHFHDYGKLFFALVMLWAYLSFSQFLLIWGANLPEEIPFYLRRFGQGWMVVSVLLLVAHFVLPFLVLLSASLKQRPRTLMWVAGFVLAMRWVDIYWNVAPTLAAIHGHDGLHVLAGLWIDLAAVLGLGGIWLWMFLANLRKRPLVPVNDPYLTEALADD